MGPSSNNATAGRCKALMANNIHNACTLKTHQDFLTLTSDRVNDFKIYRCLRHSVHELSTKRQTDRLWAMQNTAFYGTVHYGS